METLPLITVIIPVYNVEPYLRKCVDSVIAQSYPNLEILLVDDGSPDNCGKICDEYAVKDRRIKVIHKPNGGLSDARNTALDVMTGAYVTFIDSDDQVSPRYIGTLYDLTVKYGADISVSSLQNFYRQDEIVSDDAPAVECGLSREEALRTMFYQDKFDNAACAKLYKSGMFRGIRYPKGMIYEDFGTTYKLLLLSNRVAWSSRRTYYYLQRSGSIERTGFSDRNLDAVPLATEMLSTVSEREPDCYKAAVCRCVCLYWHVLLLMPPGHPEEKELIRFIRKHRLSVLFDPHARPKTRIACFCSLPGFKVARYVFSLIRNSK